LWEQDIVSGETLKNEGQAMNTGKKISLIYSGITIGLVTITSLIFYVCTSNYTRNIYYHYLEEKAHAVAEEKFSEDELDPVKYRNVILQRKRSIPTSRELFINLADRKQARSRLSVYLDPSQIQRLYDNETVNFEKGQLAGTSFIYYDNTGTFAVIVLSRNPFIKDINYTLRWAMLLLIVFSSFTLFLISRLYAIRMLNRIDKDYQTEKMFVNNASHEINNPLTAIQGECEVALMADYQAEEYKDVLRRISEETQRIILIMKELLQFSHARDGRIGNGSLEPVRISALLDRERNPQVEILVLHDFTLMTDVELLRIALHNLVSNAVKYSNGHSVVVRIKQGVLVVEDKGIGIPPSDLKHIFEPFFRASNTGSVTGKGIGLALSKAILEKLGATIVVSSREGEGTQFKVTFPSYR
jgi:signal transduction histidine kinase